MIGLVLGGKIQHEIIIKASTIDQTFCPHLKSFRCTLFLTSTQTTQIHVIP